MGEDFFAPPPFRPDESLVALKRALRALQLVERGNGFELAGKRVVELELDATTITAKLARRPALVPEWDTRVLRSSADQRKLLDEAARRLARWRRDD